MKSANKNKSRSRPTRETVIELQNLCASFTTILQNTGIDAHEMQGDLGKVLDLYVELCYLTHALAVKSDPHISKLLEHFDQDFC